MKLIKGIILSFAILTMLAASLSADVILNNFQIQRQDYPSATMLSNGNIAVSWGSFAWLVSGAIMNIYSHDLTPLVPSDFPLAYNFSLADGPAVLGSSADSFYVAAYPRYETNDSTDINLFIRKFNNDGTPITGDIRVNSDSTDEQWPSAVIINDSLEYILVLWESINEYNGDIKNFFFKRFDFDLNALTGDIAIYNYNNQPLAHLHGALISPSKLMAVWANDYTELQPEIFARTINIDGSDPSDPLVTHTYNGGLQVTPSISSILGGGAIVVWGNIDGLFETSIWGRRFDYNGAPIDMVEILLSIPDDDSNGTFELQTFPVASQNSQGYYAVSWRQVYSDMMGVFKPMVRFFDSNLIPISDTIKTNDMTGNVRNPTNIFVTDDNLLACWTEDMGGNSDDDILGTIIPMTTSDVFSNYDGIVKLEISSIAYPNPFNSSTTIELELTHESRTLVEVFDLLGRKVRTLTDEYIQAGNHQIGFNASSLPSGTYFYRIKTNQFTVSKKLTLLK